MASSRTRNRKNHNANSRKNGESGWNGAKAGFAANIPCIGNQPMTDHSNKSYGEAVKSSTLIGVSSLLNVCFSIVRAKAMAVLLGPAGVGLLGLYGSIADLTRSAAGLGINSSGVRQIAEAVGTGDNHRIACTVTALRRVALFTGALGSFLLLIFCKQASQLTFGDDRHAGQVALLALAVFFTDISAAQGALVQGMRRIADLARMNVLGAFYGTVFSIPIIYLYGEEGVVPSLVCVAGMGIMTSWWYARKIKVRAVAITLRQLANETSALLKLGIVFMASGLFAMGAAYLSRTLILRMISVEASGFYQAAWALSGIYVGFILQAMSADFYPRLTAVANNNNECNRLVNEQAEVGLLMAGPGLLATLTFAPLIIHFFYSSKFEPAVEILRWNCLGMLLQVSSWPMGFIVLAKGERKIYFWSELASYVFYVAMVWLCVRAFGLKGAGIAFFILYAAHWIGIWAIVHRLSGYRWSAANKKLSLLFGSLISVFFLAWYVLPHRIVGIGGTAITLLVGIQSLKTLCALVPHEQFPRPVQHLLFQLRLSKPNIP